MNENIFVFMVYNFCLSILFSHLRMHVQRFLTCYYCKTQVLNSTTQIAYAVVVSLATIVLYYLNLRVKQRMKTLNLFRNDFKNQVITFLLWQFKWPLFAALGMVKQHLLSTRLYKDLKNAIDMGKTILETNYISNTN